ncbi:homologue of trithorax [Actinidia rufa]|uniref:Homologue of trithorax n=1 Tax=Actinidia rufa TaxID=165716 RepID=A0A7J0F2M7_9ERIC|nr:homologue of trithorax [Actinidia rufa]
MAFGTRSFNYNNVKAEEVEEADNHHQQGEEIETGTGTPIRYVPLCDLYSATSPCVGGSSNGIVSKKVKARKLLHHHNHNDHNHNNNNSSNRVIKEEDTHNKPQKPPIINFYTRKRPRNSKKSLFFDSSEPLLDSCANGSVTLGVVKEEQEEEVGDEGIDGLKHMKKQKRKGKSRNNELLSLGVDLCELGQFDDGPRMRGTRKRDPKLQYNNVSRRRKRGPSEDSQMVDYSATRWIRSACCKQVYWPLDDDWYTGRVVGYNGETGRHQISYEDGDEESIVLSNERIKFYVSRDQMQRLNLSYSIKNSDADGLDFSEMVVLAASFEDCHELGPGDIIWAKLPGENH